MVVRYLYLAKFFSLNKNLVVKVSISYFIYHLFLYNFCEIIIKNSFLKINFFQLPLASCAQLKDPLI